jgi:hypothetical protein
MKKIGGKIEHNESGQTFEYLYVHIRIEHVFYILRQPK